MQQHVPLSTLVLRPQSFGLHRGDVNARTKPDLLNEQLAGLRQERLVLLSSPMCSWDLPRLHEIEQEITRLVDLTIPSDH